MEWEGKATKRIYGDGARELGPSAKSLFMLAERDMECRSLLPRAPQSKGVGERWIKQLMIITLNEMVKSGREECLMLFKFDGILQISGMIHEYLVVETSCKELTSNVFIVIEFYVRQ